MNLSGNIFDYFVVFGAGAVVSFSPCVYPLLPVSIGVIGAKAATSRFKGFLLSLIYVLGTAITYSILGAFASLSGKIFGQINANPISYLISGIACILFGLSVLGVFNLPLPDFLVKAEPKKGNLWSIFVLGLVSGLIIGPCTAPVLGAILVYVATRQNIAYGMSLLFTYAYAQGLVLILAGTFSGFLASLPKSGKWLLNMRKFCGFLLVGAGGLFLFRAWRLW